MALEQALASLDELAPGCSARVYHALTIHQVTQVDTHRWLLAKLAAVPKWVRDARSRGFLVSYVIEDAPVAGVLERKERRRFRKAKRAVRKYANPRGRRRWSLLAASIVARLPSPVGADPRSHRPDSHRRRLGLRISLDFLGMRGRITALTVVGCSMVAAAIAGALMPRPTGAPVSVPWEARQ